jgi:Dolichyl-phosphate-mannose-protein mannosyltransferase
MMRSPALRLFFGTRLLLWAAAIYGLLFLAPERVGSAGIGYVMRVWARSDSDWFLGIAQHGYQLNGGEVFYPLYPLLMAGIGRASGGHYVQAGIFISLVCGAYAFVLLYRLALPRLGAEGARRALLYLAVFPMSLFLQAVYSESLFLLCAVAAFVLAERGRWLPAAVAIGLALLTRIAGAALLPAIGLMAWQAPERRRAVASLAVAPLIAALYPFWLWLKLDAPRSEFSNEAGWNRHLSHAGPFGGLWKGLRSVWAGIEQVATGDRAHSYWPYSHSDPLYVAAHNLEDFAFFAVFLWLGIVAWRRFGAPYGLYVIGGLALPLSVPHLGYPLLSMPRFCLTLFPAFFALASVANTARRELIVVVTSCLLLGVAVTAWATGAWVS